MNLLQAEQLTNRSHFQFEEKHKAGPLFSCFDHSADDGQIDGGQEVPGPVIDEGVLPESNMLLALGDHGDARLVCRGTQIGRSSSSVETQTGDFCYALLCRAYQRGNPASQVGGQLTGPAGGPRKGFFRVFLHVFTSHLLIPTIHSRPSGTACFFNEAEE